MDTISKLTTSCLSHSNSSLSFLSEENRTITERLFINHVTLKEVQHIIETLPIAVLLLALRFYIDMLKKSPYVVYEALSIIFNKSLLLASFATTGNLQSLCHCCAQVRCYL